MLRRPFTFLIALEYFLHLLQVGMLEDLFLSDIYSVTFVARHGTVMEDTDAIRTERPSTE